MSSNFLQELKSKIYFNNKKILTGVLYCIHFSKNTRIINNLGLAGIKKNVNEIILKIFKV